MPSPIPVSNTSSTATMGPLFLNIDHTDGRTTWQDGVNGPTDEMCDVSPDESGCQDYFRQADKRKEMSWLHKLGLMLVNEKDPDLSRSVGGKVMLKEFPKGYRLFDHVKTTPSGGGTPKTRVDSYLYGHPAGPRKRFRSSADFFPHLVWLASDPKKNSANCTCRACTSSKSSEGGGAVSSPGPASPAPSKATTAAPVVKEKVPAVTTPVSVITRQKASVATATVPAKRSTVTTRRTVSTASTPVPTSAAPAPAPVVTPANTVDSARSTPVQSQSGPAPQAPIQQLAPPPPTAAPTLPTPSPVPLQVLTNSARSWWRNVDLRPGEFIFRHGELVWYKVADHWALGIIIDQPILRQGVNPLAPTKMANATEGYLVQPLKSPFTCQQFLPSQNILPTDLRPWLTWSTPNPTQFELQAHGLEYDLIAWDRFQFSPTLEVDASILKSRFVDATYTLIDDLGVTGPDNSRYYAGVYYGAEKLWVGDVAKLKANPAMSITGNEVLVINGIRVVKEDPELFLNQNHPARRRNTGVVISGDVYAMRTYPASTPAHVTTLPNWLPAALTTDTKFRNQVTAAGPNGTVSTWTCIRASANLRLEQLKGRWYESRIMIPLLKDESYFRSMCAEGRWDEIAGIMNEMGSAGCADTKGWIQCAKREDAFVASVPPGRKWDVTGGIEEGMGQLELREVVDLTMEEKEEAGVGEEEEQKLGPVEEEEEEGLDDEFMRKINEDAASFYDAGGDGFYGGL